MNDYPQTDEDIRTHRLHRLLGDSEKTMRILCAHIEAGGSLITICETWDVPFGRMNAWVREDDGRRKQYVQSLEARAEWAKETVLIELQRIAVSDLRQLFSESGQLLDPKQWPDCAAKAVAALEMVELFEGKGDEREQVGFTKKLKLWDKTRALENWGKTMAMFVEKHEHSGTLTLEDLVAGANKKPEEK